VLSNFFALTSAFFVKTISSSYSDETSSADEIANVNFLQRYRTRTSTNKTQKRTCFV